MAGVSQSTGESSGQSTGFGQGTSESHSQTYIPDYPQAPLLQAIAQYAFDQAPQVYAWGMDQFNKNQGNIDGLMRDALSYASPQRIAVDMGMAESGVQQGAEKGRLSAIRDLESYGIDPSSGRYAALDQANRVMASASAAGAGNQQRMADEAAGNAMRNQAISASLQNNQIGYEASKAMNALLGTGMQLKYPPLGQVSDSTSQHTQTNQSTQQSKQQSTSVQGGGGGGGGQKPPQEKPPPDGKSDDSINKGTAKPQAGAGAGAGAGGKGGGGGGGKPGKTPEPGPGEPKPPGPEGTPEEVPVPTPNPLSPDQRTDNPLEGPTPGDYPGQYDPSQFDPTPQTGDYPRDDLPPEYQGDTPNYTGAPYMWDQPEQDPNQYDWQGPGDPENPSGPNDTIWSDQQYDPNQYDTTQMAGDYQGQYDPNQYDYTDPESAAPFNVAGDYWTVPQDSSQFDYGDQYQGGDYGFDPSQGWDQSQFDYSDPYQGGDYGFDPSQYDFGDTSDYGNYDYSDPGYDQTFDYSDSGYDQSSFDQADYGYDYSDPGYDQTYDYGDQSGGGQDTSGDYSGADYSGADYSSSDNSGDYTDYSYARGGPVQQRRQDMPMMGRGPMRPPGQRPPRRPMRPPMRPPGPPMTGYNPNPQLPFGPRSGGALDRPPQRPTPPDMPRMAGGGGVPPRPMGPLPPPNITQQAAGGPQQMPRRGYMQTNGMPQSQAGIMPPPQRMQGGGPAHPQRGPDPGQATQGGFVSRELSPSGGSQTDDVDARLNAGEFVIPKDVAKWKGREFFYKLIQQARKNGQGGGGGGQQQTGYGGPRQ